MKNVFGLIAALCLSFSVPVFASADELDWDQMTYPTMEKRETLDLEKYGIVEITTEKQVGFSSSSQCSINFSVNSRRNFQNRNNADRWCSDVHRFTGRRNSCFVRQFGNNFYEANFRFRGQGRGDRFNNVFNNIFRFLTDSGVLNEFFDVFFDNIFNNQRRC